MKGDEYAGFWIRVGANLIDLIIFVVIYGVLSILSMYLFSDLYLQNVNYQNSYSSFDFFELFFQYLLPFFVTIWFWIRQQETLAHDNRIPFKFKRISVISSLTPGIVENS